MGFTAERFIPGHGGAQIAYEHVLRYLFAKEAVRGKRVLDLGSGEGYGAYILAQDARKVVGLDSDADTVRHAAAKYTAPNLMFVQGSALAVPLVGPFDVITCFETIEHVEDPETLLAESKRLLQPDGVLLVSTPNKRTYSDEPQAVNPFHAHEFYFDEFRDLLQRYFEYVVLYGQRLVFGASMWNLSPHPALPRIGEQLIRIDASRLPSFQVGEPCSQDPLYFVAVCSDQEISESLIYRSVYLNDQSRLMQSEFEAAVQHWQASLEAAHQERDRLRSGLQALDADRQQLQQRLEAIEAQLAELQAYAESLESQQVRLQAERVQLQAHIDSLEAARADLQARAQALEAERGALQIRAEALAAERQRLREQAESLEADLEQRRRQAEQSSQVFEAFRAATMAQIQRLSEERSAASATLQAIEGSVAWKLILRYRMMLDRFAPPGTRTRRVYRRAVLAAVEVYRRLKRRPGSRPSLPRSRPELRAPGPPDPEPQGHLGPPGADTGVDIVVPVYNGLPYVKDCLQSVLAHTDLSRHHLIIIDDGSTDPAVRDYLAEVVARHARVAKITFVVHPENQGFVRTVNEGLRGSIRDVIVLNADTLVTRGWVEKLQRAAYSDWNIATVTPLSNNATICSVPEFAKENEVPAGFTVDSFATLIERIALRYYPRIPTAVGFCMYVRRKALEDVGYFDEVRFERGYGEENDFCMRASRRGWVHALDDATYIYHKGAASFTDHMKCVEVERHLAVLNDLYPDYLPMVHRFIAENPLRPLHDHLKAWLRIRGSIPN